VSGGKQGSAARAFQRVKADEWLDKKGAWDNSYEGTFGQDGWGWKAQEVLGKVRGKDFRHEKTKKKRGSYKGGEINPDARTSYKFDSGAPAARSAVTPRRIAGAACCAHNLVCTWALA
jgi:hypothetical protein